MRVDRFTRFSVIGFFVVLLSMSLSGCSTISGWFEGDEKRLEGERIPVLQLQKELEPDDVALSAMGLVVPEQWKNEFWPQNGGYPVHTMQNLQLSSDELSRVWKTSVSNRKNAPIVSQPIVIDGNMYVLDSRTEVVAIDLQHGKKIWSIDVKSEGEREDVIGGGVAFSGGYLYVTSGYKEVLAISPSDGKILWRSAISSPARAAPSVMDGRVFVITLDNRIIALDAENGKQIWEYAAMNSFEGIVGAASPAVNHEIVVPVFSSGEIYAIRVENGSVVWSDNLSSLKGMGGLESISDITALPVIDKGMIFAVSFGGRIVAIEERNGTRVWQRDIGSAKTPWVAGNHLFLVSTDSKMIAFGRDEGTISWVVDLDDALGNDELSTWTAPVLAGGRLFTINDEGVVIEISPADGKVLRVWDSGSGVSVDPIVAGGTMYILHDNGSIEAYR